jgi:hypothetical protein
MTTATATQADTIRAHLRTAIDGHGVRFAAGRLAQARAAADPEKTRKAFDALVEAIIHGMAEAERDAG